MDPKNPDYDFDELYGSTLAEDCKKLAEDVEHYFFICTGILMCALSDWFSAALAGFLVVMLRDFFRFLERRRRNECCCDCGDGVGRSGGRAPTADE